MNKLEVEIEGLCLGIEVRHIADVRFLFFVYSGGWGRAYWLNNSAQVLVPPEFEVCARSWSRRNVVRLVRNSLMRSCDKVFVHKKHRIPPEGQ